MRASWLRLWRSSCLLALIALVLTACAGGDDDDAGLTVFAAASLRSVTGELERAWLAQHPDALLTLATEASNVLSAQISEGAPADVFLSADTVRPQQLAEADLTVGDPVLFAANRLTLVVPAESATVTSVADLAMPGVRIVAISEGAPIARYTRAAIDRLAQTTPSARDFAAAVESNVVSREDNVRAALAKVELGEGDAAFVYVTDALGSERVRVVPWPDGVEITAEYAAVQVSDHPLAAEFVAWLHEPAAAAVIEAAGFEARS